MQAKLPTSFLSLYTFPPSEKKKKKKKKKGPNYQKGEKKKDAHHALSMNLKKALSHTTKYASIKEFFLFFFFFVCYFFLGKMISMIKRMKRIHNLKTIKQ